MNFIKVKKALIQNVLGPASDNKYHLLGYQSPKRAADDVAALGAIVQCYFLRDTFPKSKGSQRGPVTGDVTYQIDVTVNSAARVDIETINDPEKTPEEKGRAIKNALESSLLADDELDVLIAYLYQVLMDVNKDDFGLGPNMIGERWVSRVEKDEPGKKGEQATLSASFEFNVSMTEELRGEVGVPVSELDLDVDIVDDDIEKTGIKV